jgi:hypothetical protein
VSDPIDIAGDLRELVAENPAESFPRCSKSVLLQCAEHLENASKDRGRLEWLVVSDSRNVVHGLEENGQPDGFFAVSVGPHIVTGWHDNYADATDEAMALTAADGDSEQ